MFIIFNYLASSPTLSRDADQNEYPFIVAVETCGYPICYPQCAGVVISKSWILTLGSCAYIADYDHFRINAGVVNLTSEDAQLRDIEKSVLHPEFDYWQ
uniref:Venom serine proteinase-like protein 1 n=1 Tax=Diabrotica virgifera virgifera TaxID=50390 RepID=A0A6P7G7D0_DIAVI